MEFWISIDGQEYGPYDPSQVQEMVQGGQLAPDTHIWFPDRQAWVPAQYLVGYVPAPQLATVGAAAGAVAVADAPVSQETAPVYDTARTYATSDEAFVAAPQRGGINGWAIAALVVGVLALGISWIPLFNVISLAGALLGLVLVLLAFVWMRKGAGGKGMAIAALVMCVAAAAVSVLVSMVFVGAVDQATDELVQAAQNQPADPSLITLGAPSWTGASTEVTATVTNTTTQAIGGGTFTVQAVARNGTLVDTAMGSLPELAAGATSSVNVNFAKRIPPGATMSVTEVSTFAG